MSYRIPHLKGDSLPLLYILFGGAKYQERKQAIKISWYDLKLCETLPNKNIAQLIGHFFPVFLQVFFWASRYWLQYQNRVNAADKITDLLDGAIYMHTVLSYYK